VPSAVGWLVEGIAMLNAPVPSSVAVCGASSYVTCSEGSIRKFTEGVKLTVPVHGVPSSSSYFPVIWTVVSAMRVAP
jgi:hypothetical protein